MQGKVIILYGPPGSGKGMQAYLLNRTYGFPIIDMGSLIEARVHDPKSQNNPFIKEQRKRFDHGELCDSRWVEQLFIDEISRYAKCDISIVLSGSLRTKEETFNNARAHGVLRVLERFYGKDNLYFLNIVLSEKESIARNSKRRICSVCGVSAMPRVTSCQVCKGKLRKRKLDIPSVIKHRYHVFKTETEPVIKILRQEKYNVHDIKGAQKPYQVFQAIQKWLS